jgi:two-component system chemotaxis response regulator CheB
MSTSTDPGCPALVAVVGSAGSIPALEVVLGGLEPGLPAAVLVVVHLHPRSPSVLASILARSTGLAVRTAVAGARPEPGVVDVAPPDAPLLVGPDGMLRLDRSALVHHVRPSADALLLSLALAAPTRRAAVVLSGTGLDGAAGAAALARSAGHVIAQDEATSQFFGMPGAAILAGGVDEVLPLDGIAPAVLKWVAAR